MSFGQFMGKSGLVEAATNSIGGYPIGFLIGIIVLPLSAVWIQKDPVLANMAITSIYVTVSFVRTYLLRRVFSKQTQSENRMGIIGYLIGKRATNGETKE